MYKDPDKQREANRKAQAKFKAKGITEGITGQGITDTKRVIPKYPSISDAEFTRLLASVPPGTPNIRVSKPGDADYVPHSEITRAYIQSRAR